MCMCVFVYVAFLSKTAFFGALSGIGILINKKNDFNFSDKNLQTINIYNDKKSIYYKIYKLIGDSLSF